MICVLGRTKAEAQRWIEKTTYNHAFYVPCATIEQVLGYEWDDVIVVGEFWVRPDAARMLEEARARVRRDG